MATEVHNLLVQQQNGQYTPTEEDNNLLKLLNNSRKQQDILPAVSATEEQSVNRFGPGFDKYLNHDYNIQETLGQEAAEVGYGNSRFDRGEFIPEMDLEHRRAIEQSGFNKILNGAMKGGVYALTTAVETTAGIIDGLLEGGYELGRQIATGDSISPTLIAGKGVNNWTARTMADIQKLSEEWFPNYRTNEEQTPEYQKEWWKHLGTANFIGDMFLKNLGFTVGAIGGGALWSKALNAGMKSLSAGQLMKGVTAAAEGDAEAKSLLKNLFTRMQTPESVSVIEEGLIPKVTSKAAKGLNKLNTKHELFGSVLAAMGEGTMEGVMAKNEFVEDYRNKLDQEFEAEYGSLPQRLADELADTDNVQMTLVRDESGKLVYVPQLNEDGQKILQARQQELMTKYNQQKAWLEEQGDRIAATTFAFNLPLLTLSNTVQFGRMLSGGFKTVRNNVAKVAGELAFREGEVAADYSRRIGNKALRIAGKSLKVGATEAAEEMSQGFFSSGAKNVADARMTSFNDSGYDRQALRDMGSWLSSFMEGGEEYLSDITNWQEGYLGLITGLLGVPGRRISKWNGGILGAVAEVNQEDELSQKAANVLNKEVNSERFKNTWMGAIRHKKYENDMVDAALNDDQNAWKTADDMQLVNDVIMFADAGRLDDLKSIVDYYASMTDEQAEEKGVVDAVTSPANVTEVSNNPSEAINKVREQANRVKETIQLYSDMYDAMTTLAPVNVSQEQIKEMVATSMNVKMFEKRFMTMLDEVLTGIEPYVKQVAAATEPKEGEDKSVAETRRAREIYDMLGETLTSIGTPALKSVGKLLDTVFTLDALDEAIKESGDEELRKKFEDMKTVANDRKAFVRKLFMLEKLEPGKYEATAENVDNVAKDIRAENAAETTKNLETYDAIRNQYLSTPVKDRDAFVELIRQKGNKHTSSAKFVKTYDTYQSFRQSLAEKHPEIVNKNAGTFSRVAEILLEDTFAKSDNEDELVNKLTNGAFSLEEVTNALQRKIEAGEIGEDEALPIMVGQQFKAAVNAIKDTALPFKDSWKNTSGRESLMPAEKTVEKPQDDNSNPPAATGPAPSPTQAEKNERKPEEKEREDKKPKPDDNAPELRERTDAAEARRDEYAAHVDTTPTEDESYRQDSKGSVKLGYYQQSIPEIALSLARRVRDLLSARKTASKKEMEIIDAQLNSLDLSDFVQFDEDGNVIGGETGYAETYKWLKDNGAFEYIATKLGKNDEVVFAILEDAPKFNGQEQIVVAAVKERNDRGEITSVQPLTILHSMDRSSTYMYLDELYDAIQEDRKRQPAAGELYVFGGLTNPKTSRVFDKRPGLMRYNEEGGKKRIDKIGSYDSDAPIIVLDENNQPVLLRGNIDLSKVFLPLIYEWSAPHNGRIYYLVDNGNDTYTPIFVDREEITSSALNNAVEGSFLSDVKKIVDKMDQLTKGVTPDNLDARNENLRKGLKQLGSLVNVDGISFEYQKIPAPDGGTTAQLHITWGENDGGDLSVLPGESVMKLFDLAYIPARLSPKEKWLASSRKNLSRIIEDGLLTSNAQELRQVGVNFLFDPWNPFTGKFERVLSDTEGAVRKQRVPETGQQNIANDAELGEPAVAQKAESPKTNVYSNPVVPAGSDIANLDSILGDSVDETNLDYAKLSEKTKNRLKELGVSEKTWNERGEAFRKHVLGCG